MGIAERTLKRAKKALGMLSKKGGEIWYWYFPSPHTGTVDTVDPLGTVSTLAVQKI
jgi:hypothetical protein